jgi:hypothetical protein
LTGKLFFVSAAAVSASMIGAQRGISKYSYQSKGLVDVAASSDTANRIKLNQQEIVFGTLGLTGGLVGLYYWRKRNISGDLKVMNARLYAQAAALAALLAVTMATSAGFFDKKQSEEAVKPKERNKN